MVLPQQSCPICGKLTGFVIIGDYPMDAICQGHKHEQPEPFPYIFTQIKDFSELIRDRDEARQWARKMYRENAELRRQLAIATEALEWYGWGRIDDGVSFLNCDLGIVAIKALAKMHGGDYRSSRGILPWERDDEPAEDAIRRLRGGEK